jgi:hypothetical protein
VIEQKRIEDYVYAALSEYGCPPDKIALLQLGEPRAVPAIDAVREARDARHVFTMLGGTTGSGKTLASVLWLRDLVLADTIRANTPRLAWTPLSLKGIEFMTPTYRRSPLFVTASEVARFNRYDQGDMNRLLRAAYLVIDDLGQDYPDKSGFYLGALDEIFDVRYANKLPMVLTTNLMFRPSRSGTGSA